AAPRHVHPHLSPALLGKVRLAALQALDLPRQEDLVGDGRALPVVLVHEGGEQLLGGEFLSGEVEAAGRYQAPAADVEDLESQVRPLAVVAEDVLVDELGKNHPLPLQAALDRPDLIPQTRRVLEAEFVGGLPHANAQLLDQLRLLSLQKEDDLAHAPSVLLLRNVEDAGGRTALDLVEQAGPRPPLQHRVRAGPKLEVPVDEPQRLPD